MNKQTRMVFLGLIGLVALLAGSTTFFALKSSVLSGKEPQKSEVAASQDQVKTPRASSSLSASSSTIGTSGISERPSSPKIIYVVNKNETLFEIAQKVNQKWTEIVAANGLEDADKILAGQKLIISENEVVNFTLNNERAKSLQSSVDGGKNLFRLQPEETAKADSTPVYGLEGADVFTLKSKNNNDAVVIVNKEGQSIQINLNQPITSGEKGIWVITSIFPVK